VAGPGDGSIACERDSARPVMQRTRPPVRLSTGRLSRSKCSVAGLRALAAGDSGSPADDRWQAAVGVSSPCEIQHRRRIASGPKWPVIRPRRRSPPPQAGRRPQHGSLQEGPPAPSPQIRILVRTLFQAAAAARGYVAPLGTRVGETVEQTT
jgi:hypothetical protein